MSDAVADEGDVFNVLAAQNLTHDSNVFRLAPEQIHEVRVLQTYLEGQPLLAEVDP